MSIATPPRFSSAARAAALGVVIWGALAFGCVYPWAYWPLAAASAAAGAIGLFVSRSHSGQPVSRALLWALGGVGGAAMVQLIPVPTSVLAVVSPRSQHLLNDFDPAFAAGLLARHAVSVWPRDTLVALVLLGAFSLLLVGLTALFSTTGTRRFVEALTMFGVALALIGIVQKPLFDRRDLYGLWAAGRRTAPVRAVRQQEPFAGWMVMALPLTLALLVAGIARSMSEGQGRLAPQSAVAFDGGGQPSDPGRRRRGGRDGAIADADHVAIRDRRVRRVGADHRLVRRAGARQPRQEDRRGCVSGGAACSLSCCGPARPSLPAVSRAADWGEFNNRRGAWADAWSVVREFPADRHRLEHLLGCVPFLPAS